MARAKACRTILLSNGALSTRMWTWRWAVERMANTVILELFQRLPCRGRELADDVDRPALKAEDLGLLVGVVLPREAVQVGKPRLPVTGVLDPLHPGLAVEA